MYCVQTWDGNDEHFHISFAVSTEGSTWTHELVDVAVCGLLGCLSHWIHRNSPNSVNEKGDIK